MENGLENAFAYPAPIWARFVQPRHAGSFAKDVAGVAEGRAGTPAAKSVLRVQLRFESDRVVEARFKAYGCPTSIAVGEWIAEWSVGRSSSDLATLKAAQLRAALEIPDDRAHCALLGEDALRAAVNSWTRSRS
jgi:NifU-like protein involved in Fe-S cluster formation